MFWRKKTLLAKAEVTEGTDPTPTGAANAIETENLTIEPLAGQTITRNIDRPYMGARLSDLVDRHVVMTFDVGIAGGGAAGTEPPWGVLHRGCGYAETVDAGVSVAYSPVSSAHESLTKYLNIDGSLHACVGARGTFTGRVRHSDYPRFQYRFMGLLVAVAAGALPDADLDAWQRTIPASKTNTPTSSLDGYSAILEELTFDAGNDLQGRFLIGQESIRIVDRNASGRISIEAPALGTKNFFTMATANPPGAGILNVVHGTAAGNIVTIGAPKAQIGQPAYANVNGVAHLQMPLMLLPDEGNDELTFTVT